MSSGEFSNKVPEFELAFFKNGFMNEIALAGLERPIGLAPDEVADVLVPPKGDAEHQTPRWTFIEDAKPATLAAVEHHRDDIMGLAQRLDMRRDESLSDMDKSMIDPAAAIWVVEGGGNRTAVVRRDLALNSMKEVYGIDALVNHRIVQIGTDRIISAERNGKPNAEYEVAKEISGNFFPQDELTEFDLNLASAKADNWRQVGAAFRAKSPNASAQRVIHLSHRGMPELILVQPGKTGGSGFAAGISAVQSLVGSLDQRQLVVATNGQYRPKDAILANRWADTHKVNMLPPVIIGDEPGYQVRHVERDIITAERGPMVYVNEMAKLYRLLHHQYDQL